MTWDMVSVYFADSLGTYTVGGERDIVILTLQADLEQARRMRTRYAERMAGLESRLQAVKTRKEAQEVAA